jgi:hypothetical protein
MLGSFKAVGRRRRPLVTVVFALSALAALALVQSTAHAATWSTQTTQNASGADHSVLYDTACDPDSTIACTAVGKQTTSGINTPYAQYWNGSTWANQTTAVPAGATSSELQSNTCVSATSCVAVGQYSTASATLPLIEAWNGTSWSQQTAPATGVTGSRLRGVSCPAITACMAVGYSANGGRELPLAMSGNSGTWSLQTVPELAGTIESELYGVSCASSTSCVAVGRYRYGPSAWWGWSATWNGTSWTAQSVPAPSGSTQSTLQDVSCSDATNCSAVGSYRNASNVQVTFVVRWDGTSWTQQTSANPGGATGAILRDISCADRYSCVAVGEWSSSGTWKPMGHSWNGSTWSVETTQNPTGATFANLEGVTCHIDCLAVGWYTNSGGNNVTLGEARSSPTWVQKTLWTPLANETLSGIECTASNSCWAVGTGADIGRVYTGGTGSWVQYDTPEPVTAVYSQLRGVDCAGSSYCAAVGVYNASGGQEMPYASDEEFAPSGWDVHAVPTPSGASAALNDVYCSSSLACFAVGDYKDSGVAKTFASFWNGSTWSTRTPLNAPSSTTNVFKSVSCPLSSLDCIAVGYALVGGTYQPLVQRWSSFSWAIHTSPLPSGVSEGKLHDVSCTITNPTNCTAVGTADSQAYVIRWAGSGSTWTVETAPRPAFAQSAHFEEVSCASTTACTAVGSYTLSGGAMKTFVADWDGIGWSIHNTPNPGSSANQFLGVSCVSSTVCRAAGFGNSGSGTFDLVATLN